MLILQWLINDNRLFEGVVCADALPRNCLLMVQAGQVVVALWAFEGSRGNWCVAPLAGRSAPERLLLGSNVCRPLVFRLQLLTQFTRKGLAGVSVRRNISME